MPVKLLLELSMECESLARAEALSAAAALDGKPRIIGKDDGVLMLETAADPSSLASRLGLCHYVSELLASCNNDEIDSCVRDIDVPGPIRVRSTKVGEISVDLAGTSRRVGAVLGESKGVDLHHPASDIRIVFSKKAHIGRMIGAIDRPSFEKRKNRYMPYVYPASLHPKYARALVNLTQVPSGGRLLDPFCGTGAIVAEASLIGLKAVGSDLSNKMVEGARRNLAHLKARAELRVSDVGDILGKIGQVEGIATDPPYGRSTSTNGEKILALYGRAFNAFEDVLERRSRVAIVVPDLELLEGVKGFRLLETHNLWVHRSLTRRFCLLEKL
jgi:tRNA (guanine10-N2)-dimethyltransferase